MSSRLTRGCSDRVLDRHGGARRTEQLVGRRSHGRAVLALVQSSGCGARGRTSAAERRAPADLPLRLAPASGQCHGIGRMPHPRTQHPRGPARAAPGCTRSGSETWPEAPSEASRPSATTSTWDTATTRYEVVSAPSAGVAASLADAEVESFNTALKTMLEMRYPADPLMIPHRVWALVAKRR